MFLREKNPQWHDCFNFSTRYSFDKLFIDRGMFVVQRGQSNKEMYFQSTLYSSKNTVLRDFCHYSPKSKIHIIVRA